MEPDRSQGPHDWPDWLMASRRYRSNWENATTPLLWWIPARFNDRIYDWSLSVWATPLRRILVALLFSVGALILSAGFVGDRDAFYHPTAWGAVRFLITGLVVTAMLLVIGQATRDLLKRQNRAPWPFFTHMVPSRRKPLIGRALLVYAAAILAVFFLLKP